MKKCSRDDCLYRGELLPEDRFYLRGGGRPGRKSECKSCSDGYISEYVKRNRKKSNAYKKKYEMKNPRDRTAYNKSLARKNVELRSRYGITLEDKHKKFISQGRRCAVCQRSDMSRICVDHDHKTGRFRGVLCDNCNKAIGLIRDCPEAALAMHHYLASEE